MVKKIVSKNRLILVDESKYWKGTIIGNMRVYNITTWYSLKPYNNKFNEIDFYLLFKSDLFLNGSTI